MTQEELFQKCDFEILTDHTFAVSENFSCGNSEGEQDLNDFFENDALSYQKRLLGRTYLFTLKNAANKSCTKGDKEIVTFFTVSNDSIRITNKFAEEYKQQFLEETDLRDKSIKRFPGVLLGRLGTNEKYAGYGFGSAVMTFIKNTFVTNNRTGCRFIIVDALNNERTLNFYKRNDFKFLIDDERLEAKYVGIGVGRLPLNTRLMYFDLLSLEVDEEE